MKKVYEAPELFADEYVADTMIASSIPKNGQAANNQYCWSSRDVAGAPSPDDPSNACYT